jgi:apolipoprotein N-acyltransferase
MITEFLKKAAKVFWLLPGFLLWAAFPPMGEKMDVLFALAPLIWLSRRADAKTSAKRWFASGLFFWVATLSWMPAIVKNGGPWPLVVLGWAVLAAYCAAYFAAYGYLSAKAWGWVKEGRYWRRLLAVFFIEPVLWCGLELLRSRLGGGFAWNQLGVVAVNGGFGAPAALGGVYLLSAVIFLINGTVAGIAERVWRRELTGPRWAQPLETMLPFALVWGIFHAADACLPTSGTGSVEPVRVAMVQRNFPCVFKEQEDNPYRIYEKLVGNFSALRPELVVLAESAMCEFGDVDGRGALAFSQWLSELTGAALVAGGSRQERGAIYNSAALYQPTTAMQVYDKVHLVPFGEFIPGDKLITALQKLAPVGSCTPGELKLLPLRRADGSEVKLGVAICFEDTDSAQMRKLAAMGAEILVFVTNDSWFSNSSEAEAHAAQAVIRAVEAGIPVVRVGNSGVTGVIRPDGSANWLSDSTGKPIVDERGVMVETVVVQARD